MMKHSPDANARVEMIDATLSIVSTTGPFSDDCEGMMIRISRVTKNKADC